MNNSSLFTNVFKTLFGTQITPTFDQFVPITGSDATPAGISSMAGLQSLLGIDNDITSLVNQNYIDILENARSSQQDWGVFSGSSGYGNEFCWYGMKSSNGIISCIIWNIPYRGSICRGLYNGTWIFKDIV